MLFNTPLPHYAVWGFFIPTPSPPAPAFGPYRRLCFYKAFEKKQGEESRLSGTGWFRERELINGNPWNINQAWLLCHQMVSRTQTHTQEKEGTCKVKVMY